MSNEIGRELQYGDLKETRVYILRKEGFNLAATFWCEILTPRFGVFWNDEVKIRLVLFPSPDGTLHDDDGVIHVFEWLDPSKVTQGGAYAT